MGIRAILTLAAAVLLAGVLLSSDWLADYLWFESLGYTDVFWRIRWLMIGLFVVTYIIVFIYIRGNLHLLGMHLDHKRLALRYPGPGTPIDIGTFPGHWAIAAFAALVCATVSAAQWDSLMLFYWSQDIGITDPLYRHDIGFYLFRLPFLEFMQNSAIMITLATSSVLAALYLSTGQLSAIWPDGISAAPGVYRHLSINIALCLVALAAGYFLDRYGLLQSTSGTVYGAGFTDVHVVRIVLWTGVVLTLATAAAVLIPQLLCQRIWVMAIAGLYLTFVVVGLGILPWSIQEFYVEPNELELETPYLQHNIEFTRMAYGLDEIEVRSYEAVNSVAPESLGRNQDTIDNIRLWDWRPLTRTFRQLQQIRTYYVFNDVDVDRYKIDGAYRQVMVAARELTDELPERLNAWVNRHLQYTHGYGLAMSLASETDDQGGPVLVVKDIPPQSANGLEVTEPAIYYGEKMSDHLIVNTSVKEFDYPRGDENIYTYYQGTGGVPMNAYWKRLLFAWQESDVNILLTAYMGAESRLQIRREVRDRVQHIAPFLRLDNDPYVVVDNGSLYWIQDAYTISSRFPYSEPYEHAFNYIRNSVKVVVNAYDGDVTFYTIDPADPVLGVYQRAIPSMFKSIEQMPAGLRRHLRYPVDLFSAQLAIYNAYHVTLPQVFYNGEDLWSMPREKYGGEQIQMPPYYVLMRLPGEDHLQFLLMLPLTPNNRDNMIAWMAARCDYPEYGKLVVYKLPKERLFFGPIQLEAMFDQNTLISQQLSLWDQRGSRVIRGNILVIPIDQTFIYVEPVYLIAEGTDIPQIKRVIVSDGRQITMARTLNEALDMAFGSRITPSPEAPSDIGESGLPDAQAALRDAERALRGSDWDAFGRAMQNLKNILDQ